MGNKYSFLLWYCLLVACLLGADNDAFGQQRTADDARAIAEKFIANAPRMAFSHFGLTSFAILQKMQTASDVLQSGIMNGEPFFVFSNDSAEPGFVIVSGDERMTEILGYSYTDCFDGNNLPDGLVYLLNQYQKEWKALQVIPESERTTQIKTATQRKIKNATGVSALLSTKWNQDAPYNDKCPLYKNRRSVTGCGATAAAQVMKYHQHPATGVGSITYTTATKKLEVTYDFGSTEFDWANMLNTYGSSATTEETDAVAELMFACGAMSQMDYTPDSSGSTFYELMKGAVKYMGYDEDVAYFSHDYTTEENWQQMLVDELNAGRPLLFAAYTADWAGHCFVADGYDPSGEYPLFHINWGWGGMADGNYKTTSLRPQKAGIGGVTDAFCNGLSVLTNFQPENGMTDAGSLWGGEGLTVSPSIGNANQENTVTVNIGYVYNCSNKTFDGDFNAYLVDANGGETFLGSLGVGEMQTFWGMEDESFDVTVPSDLPAGIYSIRLAAHQSGSDIEREMCFAEGNPTYILSCNGDSSSDTNLQTTNLAVEQTEDGSLTMTLDQIANFADLSFTGNVRMAIATEDDKVLVTFGDYTAINALDSYCYLNDPRTLTGYYPVNTLQDGRYHLGAASCQMGDEGWTLLRKYSPTDGSQVGTQDEDACASCWIVNGKLSLTAPLVEEIQLSDTTLTITALQKAALTATVLPLCAENKMLNWTTSNRKVATVKNGVITAVVGGEAIISAVAKDGSGVKAQCHVTVVNPVSNIYYYVDDELYDTVPWEYAQPIDLIDAPEKEGFNFTGWTNVPQLMPAHDLNIYGTFERGLYNITYQYEDSVVNTVDLYYEDEIPAYEYQPEDTEDRTYTFLGWLLDGQDFTLTKMPGRNIVLVANVNCVVDGIATIGEGENGMTISTPSGIVVKTDATKSDLQRLPHGIYIIKTSKGVNTIRL